jgi:hypothetical protein
LGWLIYLRDKAQLARRPLSASSLAVPTLLAAALGKADKRRPGRRARRLGRWEDRSPSPRRKGVPEVGTSSPSLNVSLLAFCSIHQPVWPSLICGSGQRVSGAEFVAFFVRREPVQCLPSAEPPAAVSSCACACSLCDSLIPTLLCFLSKTSHPEMLILQRQGTIARSL